MLLEKLYTRIKRSFHAKNVEVTFQDKEGKTIHLPRKLNMLAVVSIYRKVNQKAVKRESLKYKSQLDKASNKKK